MRDNIESSDNLDESRSQRSEECLSSLSEILLKFYEWFLFLSKRIVFILLLLLPGIVGWIKESHDKSFSNNDLTKSGSVIICGYSIMFWSIFFTVAYVVFELCQVFVFSIPTILRSLSRLITSSPSKAFEHAIDHIKQIKFYIANSLFWLLFLIATNVIFSPDIQSQANWAVTFSNIIASLFLSSSLICLEKFFVQLIAIRFHRKAYKDRISQMQFTQDSIAKLFNEARKILRDKEILSVEVKLKQLKLLKTANMYDPSKTAQSWHPLQTPVLRKTPKKIEPLSSQDFIDCKTEFDIQGSQSLFFKGSDIKSVYTEATTISDNVFPLASSSNLTSKEKIFSYAKKAYLKTKLTSYDLKKAAKVIYEAFSFETTKFLAEYGKGKYRLHCEAIKNRYRPEESLIFEDFAPYFSSMAEASKVMEIFDADHNGFISKQELKDAVEALEKEKKGLTSSMRNIHSAIGTLDNLLCCFALILSLLCILLIFGVPLYSFLVTSISLIVAATFIFGNTAKLFFEGIVFLFVTHPFDVGDRVFIDEQNFIVQEIGILNTCLRRWDGQIVYSPNSILSTKNIVNVRRSPNMLEVVELDLDVNTPDDKLNALKRKMLEWLHSQSKDFIPSFELNIMEVRNMSVMVTNIFVEHRNNWQDGDKRFDRHNRFLLELKRILNELEITYVYPVQPIRVLGSNASK